MPSPHRRAHRRLTDYGHGHLFHLLCGHDFFGDGFGHRPDSIEAMREAWPQLRDEVYELLAQRRLAGCTTRTTPWAAERFDDIATPRVPSNDQSHFVTYRPSGSIERPSVD